MPILASVVFEVPPGRAQDYIATFERAGYRATALRLQGRQEELVASGYRPQVSGPTENQMRQYDEMRDELASVLTAAGLTGWCCNGFGSVNEEGAG